jgi:Fe-S oxidoreductase
MINHKHMSDTLSVPTMADFMAEGKQPEILFWVGSAGSFDDRAKKITKAFVKILNSANVDFAVLGTEESCTGDAAKRAGNEFLFQMQAVTNIEILNAYEVKRIVTACPHSYNTLKNEYPSLGGNYEVFHHTEFLQQLISEGRLKVKQDEFKGKRITFHDPCYLGRANEVYEAPRSLITALGVNLVEMKRHKRTALCCGAGGAQMFKEPENGDMDVNVLRTEDALETKPNIIATGCPYCNTMMTDGIKFKEKEESVKVLDVAELIAESNNL